MVYMMYVDFASKAYIFLLFVGAFFLGFKRYLLKEYLRSARVFGLLSIGSVYIYCLLYLDHHFKVLQGLGAVFNLEVALIIVCSIAITSVKPWGEVLMIFLCIYVLALLYQDYSIMLNVVMTFLMVGVPLFILQLVVISWTRRKRRNHPSPEPEQ